MGHGKKAKYSLWRRESEKKAVSTPANIQDI